MNSLRQQYDMIQQYTSSSMILAGAILSVSEAGCCVTEVDQVKCRRVLSSDTCLSSFAKESDLTTQYTTLVRTAVPCLKVFSGPDLVDRGTATCRYMRNVETTLHSLPHRNEDSTPAEVSSDEHGLQHEHTRASLSAIRPLSMRSHLLGLTLRPAAEAARPLPLTATKPAAAWALVVVDVRLLRS